MKIAFAGTPEFAAPILGSLLADPRIDVRLVYAQPARPSGRGMQVHPGPVEALARERGVALRTPAAWSPDEVAALKASGAEILVTAAYGILLPDEALTAAPRGALNVHGSILPRWRGAAPIQRAIQAGDSESGITLFRIVPGPVDSGPVVARFPLAIAPRETSASLSSKLSQLSARVLPGEVIAWAGGERPETAQPAEGVTRARKLAKQESVLSWTLSAVALDRTVRAFTPWPGARIGALRILDLLPCLSPGVVAAPGTVLSLHPLVVACGSEAEPGAVELTRVQRDGGKPQAGAEWVHGARLRPGDRMP